MTPRVLMACEPASHPLPVGLSPLAVAVTHWCVSAGGQMEGLGSTHTPQHYAWPLAWLVDALTTTNVRFPS